MANTKKLVNWAYALAFLIFAFGITNLVRLIPQSWESLVSLEWETGAVVSADGSEQAFDPAGRLPSLEEGSFTASPSPFRRGGRGRSG